MKKILLLAAAALMAAGAAQAKTADELRIYLNPGHGSFGPNDRPMSTIGHPGTSSLSDPDSLGFYEGRGTLPRAFGIGETLIKMGVKRENIVYSRLKNGPWPYVQGDETYNRNLSEICEEVEAGNFDMFISSHSNAATDGTSTNYPLFLYRGYDNGQTGDAGYNGNAVEGSYDMATTVWPYHYMNELDPQSYYSRTSKNVRGDISFYKSSGTRTSAYSGNQYTGYLGVLKHGVPGYLLEGFFHTYQPARHRALNFDYDRQEGAREARGVGAYFGLPALKTGDIMGSVRDMHEKINHDLYKYAANSYDQWMPVNGATVKLLKDGQEVASYTCDNEYNGIFVFTDLEPGNYTLATEMEGYKTLGDFTLDGTIGKTNELLSSNINLTVKANETVYSKLFIEKSDYEPEEEIFENYPNPVQPGYLQLASEYNFNGENTVDFEVEGTVKDMVQLGDSTIILSNDGLTPHLYLVKSSTQELVKEISVAGLYTEESLGFYSPLNAIALTADHKLVGVNSVRNQSDASRVDEGYTRGTMRLYIWDDLDSDPREWATSQLGGNYFRGDMGYTLAVNGKAADCQVVTTAVTSSEARTMRFQTLTMVDDKLASVNYDNANKAEGFNALNFGDPAQGGHMHLALNPVDETKYVIGGSNGVYFDFTLPTASAGTPTNVKRLSADFNLKGAFQFFKYAKHSLMIAPYAEEGAIKGIRMLDITNGIDKAQLINTHNSDLTIEAAGAPRKAPAEAANAAFNAASAKVNGEDIDAYLTNDASLTRFTTAGAEQEKVKGIFAYDLYSHGNDNNDWTFQFNANSDATEAFITLYDETSGEEVGTLPLSNVKEGANEFTFTSDELPGEDGQRMNWDVTLKGKNIATIALLNDLNSGQYTYTNGTQMFAAVDDSPESDYFGRIYATTRVGSKDPSNGLWAYDQQWNRINGSVLNDGQTFGSCYRLDVDPEGYVFIPDWGDPHSGVYVVDPSDLEGPMNQFFNGTRDGDGLFTNAAGEKIGSSSTAISIVGEKAATKAYIHAEDNGNDVAVYQLGQPDGTILRQWDAAPQWLGIGPYLVNGNVNVKGDAEHGGVWVSQIRSAGNNAAGVPSLMFVTDDGTIQFNSGSDLKSLNGSMGAGFAISPDGSTLAIQNGSAEVEFFNIVWSGNKPTLSPLGYSFPAEVRRADASSHKDYVYQMNYDWGGNLIVTGSRMGVYSMPTDNNESTTPAKKKLIVRKGRSTGINDVAASQVKLIVTPNPTTGLATVKGVEVKSLVVYNVNGAQVAQSGNDTVDLSNLAAGIYFIKVNGGEAVRVIKK